MSNLRLIWHRSWRQFRSRASCSVLLRRRGSNNCHYRVVYLHLDLGAVNIGEDLTIEHDLFGSPGSSADADADADAETRFPHLLMDESDERIPKGSDGSGGSQRSSPPASESLIAVPEMEPWHHVPCNECGSQFGQLSSECVGTYPGCIRFICSRCGIPAGAEHLPLLCPPCYCARNRQFVASGGNLSALPEPEPEALSELKDPENSEDEHEALPRSSALSSLAGSANGGGAIVERDSVNDRSHSTQCHSTLGRILREGTGLKPFIPTRERGSDSVNDLSQMLEWPASALDVLCEGCDSSEEERAVLESLADEFDEGTTSGAFDGINAPQVARNELALELGKRLPHRRVAAPRHLHSIEWDSEAQYELLCMPGMEDSCLFGDIATFFVPSILGTVQELLENPTHALVILGPVVAAGRAVRTTGWCLRHMRWCTLKTTKHHAAGTPCTDFSKMGQNGREAGPTC